MDLRVHGVFHSWPGIGMGHCGLNTRVFRIYGTFVLERATKAAQIDLSVSQLPQTNRLLTRARHGQAGSESVSEP